MAIRIPGVIVRQLEKNEDHRGWLAEIYRQDELGDVDGPAMAYVSMIKPGVVRGPHEHRYQTDLFCFVGPTTFRLYLWDNRAGSAVYREKQVIDLKGDRPTLVRVPPGVVHAYKNTGSQDGYVFNAPDRLYAGEGKSSEIDEIRWEESPDSPFALN
jgi:dTDP-4-dehydrorhamnose 3,5-epimerase